MARAVVQAILLFVLPFVLYGGWVVLLRRLGRRHPAWARGRQGWLAVFGLALALAALASFGASSRRGQGAYVPAHMEDGRLVPGRIQ